MPDEGSGTTLTLRVNSEDRAVVFPTHHTLLEIRPKKHCAPKVYEAP